MKKTFAEQITDLENTRAAAQGRMEEVTEKCMEEGRTKDDEERVKFDEAKDEVKRLDAEISDLKEMQAMAVTKAVPVKGDSTKSAEASRSGIIEVKRNLPKGTAYARYVKALVMAKGSRMEAAEIAKQWTDTPEVSMAFKAAMAAGSVLDSDWAQPLVPVRNMNNEIIEMLRNASILSRIPGLRMVPFNTAIPTQTQASSPMWVGEGAPKPVSELKFGTVSLAMDKVAGIVVITEELARSSSPAAEGLIITDLTAQIGQFLDDHFINPAYAAVANVSPASVTNGVTPIAATNDPQADLQALISQFVANNKSLAGSVFIADSATAASYAMLQNAFGQAAYPGVTLGGESGTLLGRPLIVSDTVPTDTGGGTLILMRPQDILVADEGRVEIDVSREASLQMNSTPDNPATASTVYTSLWQNNLVGIRAERWITWTKARAGAVSMLNGISYTV